MNNLEPLHHGSNFAEYFTYNVEVRVLFNNGKDEWITWQVLAANQEEAIEIAKEHTANTFTFKEILFIRLGTSNDVLISDKLYPGVSDLLAKTIRERDEARRTISDLKEGAHPDTIYPIRRIEQLIEQLKSLKDKDD